MTSLDITGPWDASGYELSIAATQSGHLISQPGVPPGFESPLERTGENTYRIVSGPFAGAVCAFVVDDAGTLSGAIGAQIPLRRLDRPPEAPAGFGLTAPIGRVDPRRDQRFAEIWDDVVASPSGRLIDGRAIEPLHEFVQWLMDRQLVIFHGSNNIEIDEFKPVRTSMELNDTTGRGNLGAVYGTHDGLWSMFFAVIDRTNLEGSIRNGVSRYTSRYTGELLDLYHFSIHDECLDREPYTTGALYLMPRDHFVQIPYYADGPPSNEWACHEPVRPLARLLVAPSDFPFLEGIAGHDDRELIAFGRLERRVFDRVISATRTGDGFTIVTTASRIDIDTFIETSAIWYPDVTRRVTPHEAGLIITMTGPPAFLHDMERRLQAHLDE